MCSKCSNGVEGGSWWVEEERDWWDWQEIDSNVATSQLKSRQEGVIGWAKIDFKLDPEK